MGYEYLCKIDSPENLKKLPEKEIPKLCGEIRNFLIENIEQTGGHLASNLGVAEVSVAIHRIFNSPEDHIIFDVGHQSYVHKIITGRAAEFSNLRKTGGLSGFTSMKESKHDAFGAGHSSTSISAALGYAEADRLNGKESYTVALIGDGAFTGGMTHEALNNCDPNLRLIIILNENGMSISVNKGRFASYLSRVRVSKGYRVWKKGTVSFLRAIPLVGKPITSFLTKLKQKIKNAVFVSNYFEELGLYYIGPVDGNDYKKVQTALREAKSLGKCAIVHIKTKKGKGYEPAEKNPDNFHSVYANKTDGYKTFHEVFAEKLIEMSENDDKIVAVTAAMGIGTGLDSFGKKYPKRYFDVGIAEEHALTFSAGLAASGMKPFVAIYSTFLQRAYDNIIHDVALQDLPVRIIVDRASLAVADGATHHGIFDVAFLSHIPGVSILSPVTNGSLKEAMNFAKDCTSPIVIRYANTTECEAVDKIFYPDGDYEKFGFRTDFCAGQCKNVFICYGSIVSNVIKAKELLKNKGVSVGIILLEKLKPYHEVAKKLIQYISSANKVVFVEEGIKTGGAGACLREELLDSAFDFSRTNYEIVAIDDNFAYPDAPCELYDYLGMSPERLSEFFFIK